MIPDVHRQSSIEVFESMQIEQSPFEDFHLGADMKHEQSQKIIDTCVNKRPHCDSRGLSDERDFEIRARRYVAQIIRLQYQRSPRICYIRQISHGVSEARRDDENKHRQKHHDASKYDEPPCNFRLFYHSVAFHLRLRFHPIGHHHIND